MPSHHTPDAERRRQQKYTRLIQRAIPGKATIEDFQAVADFLSDEQYFQPLAKILEAFDATVPPLGPSRGIEGPATAEEVLLASSSVSDCVPLFQSLLHAKRRTPRLGVYIAECMAMTLERWAAIVRWMAYLVTHAMHSISHKKIAQDCADALYAILAKSGDDTIKQELWFIHGTAKLVYLLLCQAEIQAGKYLILSTPDSSGEGCSMAQLFKGAFEDSSVWDVMRLEWKSQAPHMRRKFAAALIGRVQQMVDMVDSHNLHEMAVSVLQLVSNTTILTGDSSGQITMDLERQGFLFEFASAITALANKAQRYGVAIRDCWVDIATAMVFLVSFVLNNSTNPQRFMPRLIAGGIMRCASLCLPWDYPYNRYGRSSAVLALQWILPFLTKTNIHAMVEERGDFKYFLEAKDNPSLPPNARKVCQEVSTAALQGRQAASVREGSTVNMCSNTKHSSSTIQAENAEGVTLKSCSRCHGVFYCSATCQAEDWRLFHSVECQYLGQEYEMRKTCKVWTNLSTWLDRLHFVEVLTNHYLPPLPEYLEATPAELFCTDENDRQKLTPKGVRTYPPGAAISLFDLTVFDHPWPMDLHKVSLNTHQMTWRRINHVWDARIQRCVEDVLEEPDKYVLVEGVFPFHDKDSMFVFAKMKYEEDARECGKYKVVNSAFRVGKRGLRYSFDHEGFDDVDDDRDSLRLPIVGGRLHTPAM